MNPARTLAAAVAGALCLLITGCSSMTLDNVKADQPVFDFRAYFSGHTRASGWFSDRFGTARRHFCGDFYGEMDGDAFVLDETLYYTDGVVETRVWRVGITDAGVFTATSDSLVGPANGQLSGNALNMKYAMRVKIDEGKHWTLSMDDFMLLQPDGSLHNITQVKKWGIRLGTVSTQYQRHDGSAVCSVNQAASVTQRNTGDRAAA